MSRNLSRLKSRPIDMEYKQSNKNIWKYYNKYYSRYRFRMTKLYSVGQTSSSPDVQKDWNSGP